ncbi:TSCPD domain-containing protein [Clostridia bacterium]|nr:TSCPD domain-containing protein [Clostridia bacterium]
MTTYKTNGTCSTAIALELTDDRKIKSINISGGCDGNLKGIISLLQGADAEETIRKLKGIKCGKKGTSCPDQLSLALEEAVASNNKEQRTNNN